jgi:hypothetical protein
MLLDYDAASIEVVNMVLILLEKAAANSAIAAGICWQDQISFLWRSRLTDL